MQAHSGSVHLHLNQLVLKQLTRLKNMKTEFMNQSDL